jgi:hypothetical protein
MNIDDCIATYIRLAHRVFKKTRPSFNVCYRAQSRIDTKALEREIKRIVLRETGSETTHFEDEGDAPCKV